MCEGDPQTAHGSTTARARLRCRIAAALPQARGPEWECCRCAEKNVQGAWRAPLGHRCLQRAPGVHGNVLCRSSCISSTTPAAASFRSLTADCVLGASAEVRVATGGPARTASRIRDARTFPTPGTPLRSDRDAAASSCKAFATVTSWRARQWPVQGGQLRLDCGTGLCMCRARHDPSLQFGSPGPPQV